jgi:hypothetical protein
MSLQADIDFFDQLQEDRPFGGHLGAVLNAARRVANLPDTAKVRSYFVANMMDGDDGGVMTMSMKTLADEATQIVGFILEDSGLIADSEEWAALGITEDE